MANGCALIQCMHHQVTHGAYAHLHSSYLLSAYLYVHQVPAPLMHVQPTRPAGLHAHHLQLHHSKTLSSKASPELSCDSPVLGHHCVTPRVGLCPIPALGLAQAHRWVCEEHQLLVRDTMLQGSLFQLQGSHCLCLDRPMRVGYDPSEKLNVANPKC